MQADYAEWSPYNYVLGNPISFTDPTGRGPEDEEVQDGNDPPDEERNMYIELTWGGIGMMAALGELIDNFFIEAKVTQQSNLIPMVEVSNTTNFSNFFMGINIGNKGELVATTDLDFVTNKTEVVTKVGANNKNVDISTKKDLVTGESTSQIEYTFLSKSVKASEVEVGAGAFINYSVKTNSAGGTSSNASIGVKATAALNKTKAQIKIGYFLW